jgi:hypothetical protein
MEAFETQWRFAIPDPRAQDKFEVLCRCTLVTGSASIRTTDFSDDLGCGTAVYLHRAQSHAGEIFPEWTESSLA